MSDVSFANLFSKNNDGMEVDKKIVRNVLRNLAEHVRSIGVEAKIQGYTLWEPVVSFISAQECFIDPTSGKLVKPHIRACLYAAGQWCKAHQDHVGPAELVLLVSHAINKNGVAGYLACQLLFCLVSTSSCAGDWVFTPLTKEYLSLGQGAGACADAQRKKKSSHDLPHAKTVENVSGHVAFPTCKVNSQNLHEYKTDGKPTSGSRFFAQLVIQCPGGEASANELKEALCTAWCQDGAHFVPCVEKQAGGAAPLLAAPLEPPVYKYTIADCLLDTA